MGQDNKRVPESGTERVSGWMKSVWALGVIAMIAMTIILLVQTYRFNVYQGHVEQSWGFWGDLSLLAFLLSMSMILIMIGVLISTYQIDSGKFMVLAGVVIVSSCLVWAIIYVPDNDGRLELLVALLIPIGAYALFHIGYDRAWSHEEFRGPDEVKVDDWFDIHKDEFWTTGFPIILIIFAFVGSIRTYLGDGGGGTGSIFLGMMLVILWAMIVMMPALALLFLDSKEAPNN